MSGIDERIAKITFAGVEIYPDQGGYVEEPEPLVSCVRCRQTTSLYVYSTEEGEYLKCPCGGLRAYP